MIIGNEIIDISLIEIFQIMETTENGWVSIGHKTPKLI